jgi:TonB family protein
MKKKINPFKSGSILLVITITSAMFACEDEIDREIQKITESSTEQLVVDDPDVQAQLEELQRENPGVEYAVITTGYENKRSLDILQEYDPEQIEHIFVDKTDGDPRITLIINRNAEVFHASTQQSLDSKGVDDIFTVVESPPEPQGGMTNFFEYIQSNLRYPDGSEETGRVFVEFVVEKDGTLSNVKTVRGMSEAFNTEAERVLREYKGFIPGRQRGQAVRVKMVLPIAFVK